MTDIITGPGEYRTRDGQLKKIVGKGFAHELWEASCGTLYNKDGRSLGKNGDYSQILDWSNDIIGPWEEKTAEPERQGFEPFWVVIRIYDHEIPHDSHAKAAGEAQRLAHENPGQKFYVLKAESMAKGAVTRKVTVEVSNVKEQPE